MGLVIGALSSGCILVWREAGALLLVRCRLGLVEGWDMIFVVLPFGRTHGAIRTRPCPPVICLISMINMMVGAPAPSRGIAR